MDLDTLNYGGLGPHPRGGGGGRGGGSYYEVNIRIELPEKGHKTLPTNFCVYWCLYLDSSL